MATLLENEFTTQPRLIQTNLYKEALKKFRKTASSTTHLHLLFGTILFSEVIAGLIFSQALFLAIFVSLFVATCFTYFVLLFYYQARNPEELKTLTTEFLHSCKISLDHQHLSVAEELVRFSSYLEDFEWGFYKVSSPMISRFSAFCYWEDVFKTKQMLLLAAIDEHIQQIRISPTDIEVHASLGSTYVALSKLYRQPIQNPQHPRISDLKKLQSRFEEKSKNYSKLAIEEFKIIHHYASDDPWVH
ncbi:MAG TPA: hypothetical protein VLE96_06440, partial [Chlamydiales bacterium]|nr:hypothetical protein [Chlamydiales bacterium]